MKIAKVLQVTGEHPLAVRIETHGYESPGVSQAGVDDRGLDGVGLSP